MRVNVLLWKTLSDRAALYGIVTKAFQGAAGFVTAILILSFFTPNVQGYYYTFANVLALQIFLELGLSTVVTTFAAHEWAKLKLDGTGNVTGDHRALARLRSLARKVAAWYLIGGLLLLPLLVAVGSWFFDRQDTAATVEWQYPWMAMSVLASIGFVLTPAWAMLSGCGQIATVNAYRLVEAIIRYSALWICIVLDAALWSAVGALVFSTLAGGVFLLVFYRRFFRALFEKVTGDEIGWVRELAPLQARIAGSWISGYLAFSLFTPAVFYFMGPAEAGRMGMTWALISGLSGIAATWLQVQAPGFSMMVARREFTVLALAARRTAWIGVTVFVIGSGIGLAVLAFLDNRYPDIAARLIPIGPVVVFLVAECLHQVSMVQSTYLRAFKKEPFLGVSVASGLIIGGGTLWSTSQLGAYGPAVSYLLGMAVALVWGTLIFVRSRKQWTSPPSGDSLR